MAHFVNLRIAQLGCRQILWIIALLIPAIALAAEPQSVGGDPADLSSPTPGEIAAPAQGPVGQHECTVDLDCDDGVFCNGRETCSDSACQPGAPPCPGNACDETARECVTDSVPRLEAGVVEASATATRVLLGNLYKKPVIVASVQASPSSPPAVVRIGSVTGTGFTVRLQSPSKNPPDPARVNYLVVEEGAWSLDGIVFEARRLPAHQTFSQGSMGAEPASFLQTYRRPIVLGQVMSENDPRWSVFFAHGKSQAQEPQWNALALGKTVAEDPSQQRESEVLGVIVFESGPGRIGGVEFEAGVTGDTITGQPTAASAGRFGRPFATTPEIVLVNLAGIDTSEVGWAQVHQGGVTPAGFEGFVEEDQLQDPERIHPSESFSYVAFERAFQHSGSSSTGSGLIDDLDSEYFACQLDGSDIACGTSDYLSCLAADVRQCEIESQACTALLMQGLGTFTACHRCVAAMAWPPHPLRFGACLYICSDHLTGMSQYSDCQSEASRNLRLANDTCECDNCGIPGNECPNRYGLEISASGLRCGEVASVAVECGDDSVPGEFPLWSFDSTYLAPQYCKSSERWSARIGAVKNATTGEILRSCQPSQRSGLPLTSGNVAVEFDCECSGDECDSGPTVAPMLEVDRMPESSWFKLRTTVIDGCSNEQRAEGEITISWDDPGIGTGRLFPVSLPENLVARPGDRLEHTIVAESSNARCGPNPDHSDVPDSAGAYRATTVSCGCEGSQCSDQVPVNVAVQGVGIGLRPEGLSVTLDLNGDVVTSASADGPGTLALGQAAPGDAYRVTIENPVVSFGSASINHCTYQNEAGTTVPASDGPVRLGRIICANWGRTQARRLRPRPPQTTFPDTGEWDLCLPSLFCEAGQSGYTVRIVPCDDCEDDVPEGECFCTEITIESSPCLLRCNYGGGGGRRVPRMYYSVSGGVNPSDPLIADDTLRISGNATDDAGLQRFLFGIDGYFERELTASGTHDSFQGLEIDTSELPEGAHTLELMALNAEGIPNLAKVDFLVSHSGDPCAADDAAPTIAITRPDDGAELPPGRTQFFASATDHGGTGVKDVEFFVNGVRRHTDSTRPFTWSNWYPAEGGYALRAVAEDHCGNTAEAIHTVSVVDSCSDAPAPSLSITNFSDGSWIEPGLYQVETSVADHSGLGIDRVEFRVGTFNPETDSVAPYRSSGYYLTSEGPVVLEARAFDACQRSTTRTVTVNVSQNASVCELDGGAPWSRITLPAAGVPMIVGPQVVMADVGDDTTLLAGSLEIDGTVPAGFTVVSGNPADYSWDWEPTVGSHILRVGVQDVCGNTTWSLPREVVVHERPTCQPNTTTLCLQEGRFQVNLLHSGSSPAKASSLSDVSGAFWFSDPSNPEALVKVLDGTSATGGSFWLYYGTLTDRQFTLRVTDLWENRTEEFSKPTGSHCGGGSTGAFPTNTLAVDPAERGGFLGGATRTAGSPSPNGTCVPSSSTLCLQNGRFSVSATFSFQGQSLQARARSFSGSAGTFSFFGPENVELGVKVLDGTSVNGHWWVYYGSASELPYEIEVTDTTTGTRRTYSSSAFCGGGTVDDF